jgi:hypothetical protein
VTYSFSISALERQMGDYRLRMLLWSENLPLHLYLNRHRFPALADRQFLDLAERLEHACAEASLVIEGIGVLLEGKLISKDIKDSEYEASCEFPPGNYFVAKECIYCDYKGGCLESPKRTESIIQRYLRNTINARNTITHLME